MNKRLGGVFGLLLLISSSAQAMINDLFISEYVEGSGYNKAIELYNGNNRSIDLSEYRLSFYLNGAKTVNFSIQLTGMLTPNTTYVVANSLASSQILIVTDQTHDGVWFNGDDVVVLTHKGQVVDSFGQVGIKPGEAWGKDGLSSKNRTLRRVGNTSKADTDVYDNVDFARQWQGFEENDFSDLGSYIPFLKRSYSCNASKKQLNHC